MTVCCRGGSRHVGNGKGGRFEAGMYAAKAVDGESTSPRLAGRCERDSDSSAGGGERLVIMAGAGGLHCVACSCWSMVQQ